MAEVQPEYLCYYCSSDKYSVLAFAVSVVAAPVDRFARSSADDCRNYWRSPPD